MAIVGLLATLVAVTQPGLKDLTRRVPRLFSETSLPRWTIIGAAATDLLLLTGSLVTRTGASLACPSFPHCGLSEVGAQLQPYVTIQLLHRFSAFTVAGIVVAVLVYLLRYGRSHGLLRRLSAVLGLLLLAQFVLGISNVLLALPMWSRILHLATGASIWAVMTLLAVALYRARPASPALDEPTGA
jgi:cytochrome c oxidase assembly protein subunit 15